MDRGLVSRGMFQQVGLLEESFESYLEDVDFGLRCAAHGFAGQYVPEASRGIAEVQRLAGGNPDTVRRMARNQLLLPARHYPWRLLVVGSGPSWWRSSCGAVALRHGAGFRVAARRMAGIRRFFAGAARHSTQKYWIEY